MHRRIIAANGEPDTVEVFTVRGRGQRIVLTYPPSRDRRPRRITVGPAGEERVAREPSGPSRIAERPARVADPPAAPSARQRLECPIDPERPDCRALCAKDAKHEWCP